MGKSKRGGRGPRGSAWPQLDDPDWLADQVAHGEIATSLAELLGCSRHLVTRALQYHGIVVPVPVVPQRAKLYRAKSAPTKRGGRGGPSWPQLSDPAWLRERVDAGFTDAEIGTVLGCSRTTVWTARFRLDVLRDHER